VVFPLLPNSAAATHADASIGCAFGDAAVRDYRSADMGRLSVTVKAGEALSSIPTRVDRMAGPNGVSVLISFDGRTDLTRAMENPEIIGTVGMEAPPSQPGRWRATTGTTSWSTRHCGPVTSSADRLSPG